MDETLLPIQKLLDKIDSSILGVFWITEKPLTEDLPHIREMDYLSNGQLSQFFMRSNNLPSLHNKNIFIESSFGESFFICHIFHQDNEVSTSLSQIKSLVENVQSERNKLILINGTQFNYAREISKLFSETEIEEFSL